MSERADMSGEQVLPEAEVRALFIDRNTPEWVDVPGQVGSRVAFQPMSPYDRRRYLSEGQSIRIVGGEAKAVQGDVTMNVARQDLTLIQNSVVDWELRLLKPVKGDPAETIEEVNKAPRGADQRRNVLGDWFSSTMHPDFADWLVEECKRVNRLREIDLGN